MCAGLTSKCYLGVTLCAAALLGGGGCSSGGTASTTDRTAQVPSAPGETPTVRESVASAAPPVPVPLVADAAPQPEAVAAVSQSDVIAWVTRGTSDDVILDRIQHAHTATHLTAGDELRLRDAGVTDEVIRAMKAAAWN